MQEERRLFYVGITRAKDRLYLLFTQVRSTFGYNEPCDPSRFLMDIPNALLEETGSPQTVYRPSRLYDRDATAAYTWQSSKSADPAAAAPKATRYSPGAKVVHPVWGDGMVLNSRIQDDEEIVDVFFETMGLKRVAASLAHLEIKE
jgi:DNA helicase-2/ATP-dependent DNA helicase PcrA